MDSLRAIFKTKGDAKVALLSQERISRAKKMMTPFVLRRRKDQVRVEGFGYPPVTHVPPGAQGPPSEDRANRVV